MLARRQKEYSVDSGAAQLLVVDPYGSVWIAAPDGPLGGRSFMESASKIEYWRAANAAAMSEEGFPQFEEVQTSVALELGLITDLKESLVEVSSRIRGAAEELAFRGKSDGTQATLAAHDVYDIGTYPALLARLLGEHYVQTALEQQLPTPVAEDPTEVRQGIPRPPGARSPYLPPATPPSFRARGTPSTYRKLSP